jgi:hypothetical protein
VLLSHLFTFALSDQIFARVREADHGGDGASDGGGDGANDANAGDGECGIAINGSRVGGELALLVSTARARARSRAARAIRGEVEARMLVM